MDWVWASVACVLLVLSFVGCVVPVIPGPLLAFGGLLALMPSGFAPTTQTYIWFGVACAGVLVLDYVVPAFGAKKFNCSKWGVFGCIVGTMIGIFFVPWGILVGPFAGAVVGELIAGLVGLIPNCASSVVITELYLGGIIGTGPMLTGLLVNAGVGTMVLIRTNRNVRENIGIVCTLYGIALVWGVAAELSGLVL